MDEKQKKILERLQAQCVRREYCKQDILKKAIERCEGDKEAAAEIVDSLLADKFVSDLRFASAFAREKASINGWGPTKIRYQLRAKGVSNSDIDEALGEIDEDKADNRLEKLLSNKWKSLAGDSQAKLKLLKFALSRGYEYDKIKALVDKISSQSVSDETSDF